MRPSAAAALVAGTGFAAAQASSDTSALVGTWTTKSNSTFTGSRFYNPTNDSLIEPAHTGISYSFTDDGHYEESYYRAIANPTNPQCPSSVMQWQHGTYQLLSNGSLTLTPIGEDGRQLQSNPCNSKTSIYSHYNQSEIFEKYSQYTDAYHSIPRLDLYQFNGAPLPPLYLAFKPPEMLPTTTLHPKSGATGSSKRKRSLTANFDGPTILYGPGNYKTWLDADRWWWFGLGMTGVGSVLYFCF